MRQVVFFLICICFQLSSVSQTQSGLLWKITEPKKGKISYLYGTYHTQDERAFVYESQLKKLIESCEYFACEVKDEDIASEDMMESVLMEDKMLSDLYTKDEFEFVKNALNEELGLLAMMAGKMKPIITMTMIMEMEMPADREEVLDSYLQTHAISRQKKVIGLETMEEAMAALDFITLEEQAQMLMDYLRDIDEQKALSEKMTEWYRDQQLDSLYLAYTEYEMPLNFEVYLVKNRNRYFIERLSKRLSKKKTVFCAVGALHLPGETGMINGLRELGYTLENVPLNPEF